MKKLFYLFLTSLLMLSLVSCNSNNQDDPDDDKIEDIDPDDDKKDEGSGLAEGNYYTYDAAGNLLMTGNNIWTCIIKARDNSKSSNKCYVTDHLSNVVYKYSSSYYYYYRSGTYYGKTKTKSEALKWAGQYEDSYVLDGIASEFVYVGKSIQTNNPKLNKDAVKGIENYSGSYGYLYTLLPKDNSDGVGYTYMEFKLEFSKANLKYFTDTSNENGWNAYVFVNIFTEYPWAPCDMGIMQIWESGKGRWQPVFNFKGNMYDPSDSSATITQMVYNEETDTWGGADDLYFRCYVYQNKYILNITNLTTNVEYEYECINEQLVDNAYNSYIILAASNCPVSRSGGFWNPRSGNAFENIIFRDIKVAKFDPTYQYETKYDFYSDSQHFSYALTMCDDNADVTFGSDEQGRYVEIDMNNS